MLALRGRRTHWKMSTRPCMRQQANRVIPVAAMPCEPLLAFPASWNTIRTQPRPPASESKPDEIEKPPCGMAASTLHRRAIAKRWPHIACISKRRQTARISIGGRYLSRSLLPLTDSSSTSRTGGSSDSMSFPSNLQQNFESLSVDISKTSMDEQSALCGTLSG